MDIKTFYCNPYRECTYIVSNDAKQCLIIDPGMYGDKEEQRVIDYLTDNQLTPIAIFITHAHPDHGCGLAFLQSHYPTLPVIDNQQGQGSYQVGAFTYQIIPTPGHKEDAVCYYFEQENTLFTGDTLFKESIGRTDFPGGDMATLMESLAILKKMPEDTQVYPGHGYPTTIGYEKVNNPYL